MFLYDTEPLFVTVSRLQNQNLIRSEDESSHEAKNLFLQTSSSYTARNRANMINPENAHLPRTKLLEKIHYLFTEMGLIFVTLSSSAGSGKSSLLQLFAKEYGKEFTCIYISFKNRKLTTDDLTKGRVLDSFGSSYNINAIPGKILLMLDDAQEMYSDKDFWGSLIKVVGPNLKSVWFLISVTHLLTNNSSTPAELLSTGIIDRESFLLSDEEAEVFLNLENQLPPNLRHPILKHTIIQECNGLIGALAVSVIALKTRFYSSDVFPTVSEAEIILAYLSMNTLQQMHRCFGIENSTQLERRINDTLVECLTAEEPIYYSLLLGDDSLCFAQLIKLGILTLKDDVVKFSSPIAQKYVYTKLFPYRSLNLPVNIEELVKLAISHMSASLLQRLVATSSNLFPKEAVFQHLFMHGLALSTPTSCYICPQLSKDFSLTKIDGEIDFYINGQLNWGLELLVNGSGISEHIDRFGRNGKYSLLNVKDYAVIDFRHSQDGHPFNIRHHDKRITVFFRTGDFSVCNCVFFGKKEVIEIRLRN